MRQDRASEARRWMTIDSNGTKGAASLGDVTAFTVANAWFTTVPHVTKLYDLRSEFDPPTGRFTAATTTSARRSRLARKISNSTSLGQGATGGGQPVGSGA
jgi:hypothetical protein